MDFWTYKFYVTCPGERPVFWAIPVFLWGSGCNFDSDGDSYPADSTSWTELYASLRKGKDTDVIDIAPHQETPLILEVSAPTLEMAARTAYILAYHTGGEIRREAQGTSENLDDFAGTLGDDFDLPQALTRFNEVVKSTE